MNCPECDKAYKSSSGYSYHRRVKHGVGKVPVRRGEPLPADAITVIGAQPTTVTVIVSTGTQKRGFVVHVLSFAEACDAVAGGLRQALSKGR